MLVINPDECIDCGVCVPECPIDAIVPDTDERGEPFLELNRDYSTGPWPVITRRKDGMPDAEKYKDMKDKIKLFSEKPGEGD